MHHVLHEILPLVFSGIYHDIPTSSTPALANWKHPESLKSESVQVTCSWTPSVSQRSFYSAPVQGANLCEAPAIGGWVPRFILGLKDLPNRAKGLQILMGFLVLNFPTKIYLPAEQKPRSAAWDLPTRKAPHRFGSHRPKGELDYGEEV